MYSNKIKMLIGVILAILLLKGVMHARAEELQSAFDENFDAETEYVFTYYANNYLNNMKKLGYEFEVSDQSDVFIAASFSLEVKEFEKYSISLWDNSSKSSKTPFLTVTLNAKQYNEKFDKFFQDSLIAMKGKLTSEDEEILKQYFAKGFKIESFQYSNEHENGSSIKLIFDHFDSSDDYRLVVRENVPIVKPEYVEIPYQDIIKDENLLDGRFIKVTGRVTEINEEDNGFFSGIIIANEDEEYSFSISPDDEIERFEAGEILEIKGVLSSIDIYFYNLPRILVDEITK